jgi:putative ABC transport system permease protein
MQDADRYVCAGKNKLRPCLLAPPVLGATVTNLAGLLSRDFVKLVIIACLIAFPLAWWIMHDWLLNYEYRVGIGWWIFVAAGLIAVFIALATVSFQAFRAAMVNPVKSLRADQ